MNSTKRLLVLAGAMLLMSSCQVSVNRNSNSGNAATSATDAGSMNATSISNAGSDYYSSVTHGVPSSSSSITGQTPVTSSFSILNEQGLAEGFSLSGTTYEITTPGSYYLSGKFEGQIKINVGESTTDVENVVELNLEGVNLSNSSGSVIYALSADKVKIKSKKGTYNYIEDSRALRSSSDESETELGAVYAKCDLHFTGKGQLEIKAVYNNGIHTSKDLKIKNVTLKVTAPKNAIKGSNSVIISEALTNVTAISTGGDGIKSSDSGLSSKGNQKGNVEISGGTVTVYSYGDAISAAYDAVIKSGIDEDSGEVTIPTVTCYTEKYSSYSNSSTAIKSSDSDIYIRMASSYYNENYRYALYFYNSTDSVWAPAIYSSMSSGGGFRPGPGGGGSSGGSYYYYKAEKPEGYSSFKIYAFNASNLVNSTTEYVMASSSVSVNSNYDTLTITYSSSTISAGSWSTYSTSSSGGWGGDSGNTNKADESAKGIKAANNVLIADGIIYLKAYDDCIHANIDEVIESTSLGGEGNVVISGGVLTLYSTDDAIHADRYLNITGGDTLIEASYEGLEANKIVIDGGTTYLKASDDGLNASSKIFSNPSITVNGGRVDVTVSGNDVDGIDSNGTFTQTGGVVVTKAPSGSGGGMSTGLDCDGTVSVSGGTFICFGSYETTPSSSLTKKTLSGSWSNGTYALSPLNINIKLEGSWSSLTCWSSSLTSSSSLSMSKVS